MKNNEGEDHKLHGFVKVIHDEVSKKRDILFYEQVMAINEEADPTPDLVEGIFYLKKRPCLDKCRKNKENDNSSSGSIIKIYDHRSLYLFDHKT